MISDLLQHFDKIILFIAVVHAYTFSIMLFSRKQTAPRILGFYMFLTFVEYTLNTNMYMLNIHILNLGYFVLTPFVTIAMIPTFYLYVRKLTSEHFKFNPVSLIHYAPAFVWGFIFIIFLLSIPYDERVRIIFELDKNSAYIQHIRRLFDINNVIFFIQFFIYIPHVIKMIFLHKLRMKNIFSYKHRISLNWLIIFIVIFGAYYVHEFVVFILGRPLLSMNFYFFMVTFHVFFVGIMGYRQDEIYISATSANIDSIPESRKPSTTFHLPDELKQEIAAQLVFIMEQKQLYKNPDLTLYDLANVLNQPKHYISYVLKHVFKKNFYTFVNDYRIEAAKQMLINPEYDHLSIEGIGMNAGFKARNVFYPIFKKTTGMTPGEYKLRYKNLNK